MGHESPSKRPIQKYLFINSGRCIDRHQTGCASITVSVNVYRLRRFFLIYSVQPADIYLHHFFVHNLLLVSIAPVRKNEQLKNTKSQQVEHFDFLSRKVR